MAPTAFKNSDGVLVQCGRCAGCLTRRVSNWSLRLQYEGKRHWDSYFLTLTYDTDHVPISEKGLMTLRKKHVSEFMKRLRYYSNGNKIRFYACGEYGTARKRPHYHIILFGSNPSAIYRAWASCDRKTGEFIPFGDIYYGTVTGASIGYVLKYMTKPWKPHAANDDREREFQLQSQKLGDNYLTDAMKEWHLSDLENNYYSIVPGTDKKAPLPRYYKLKIYNDEQIEQIAWSNIQRIRKQQDAERAELGEHYDRIISERNRIRTERLHYRATKNRSTAD